MKVLLIQPPYVDLKKNSKRCQPPLGLVYLAAAIEDQNTVEILDAVVEGFENEIIIDDKYIQYGLSYEDIKKRIRKYNPDVIGISCLFTTQVNNVYDLAREVKKISPKIAVVVGGAHPSALPEEVLKVKEIDYAVIGEGEKSLKELLACINNKSYPENIAGIAYKKNGKIIINEKKYYIEDLDSIPFPNWSLLPLERYFEIGKPHGLYPEKKRFLPILSSRGCPNKCIFCSVHNLWGKKYRKRSAKNVLDEIRELIEKYGIEEIYFEDDNMTLDKQRTKDILNGMINEKLNIKWSSPNGIFAGSVDENIINLMKKSGCRAISFGIESGDKHMLKDVIDKNVDLEKTISFIRKAKSLNIETSAFFVLGLPGETAATLKNTLKYASRLPADNIAFFFATPLPGTRLRNICDDMGIAPNTLDYKDLRSENPLLVPEDMSMWAFLFQVRKAKFAIYAKKALRNPRWIVNKIREKLLK